MPLTPPSPGAADSLKLSQRAMQQAAEWYALLRSGEATDADRASWHSWLADHPDHRRAWAHAEAVSRSFDVLQAAPDPRVTAENLWNANARVLRRRQLLYGLAALAGTGLLGLGAWRHAAMPGKAGVWAVDHRTDVGELREIVLSDGTRLWLNTASALNEDYRPDLRRLDLLAGEVLIDTAADPRPFYVDTSQGRLQALGTRFTVRLREEETFLAVYQGAVAVRTRAGANAVVRSGQQIRFTANEMAFAQPADPAREAWSRGVLIAKDIPLGDVVRELRRYRRGDLAVAPEVAGLRVFGTFPLKDTDETLSMLAQALPIRLRHGADGRIDIESKRAAASSGR